MRQNYMDRAYDTSVNQGLRQYMLKVYNLMMAGVAMTAATTYLVTVSMPEIMIMIATTPLKWVVFAAMLGMGFFAPSIIQSRSLVAAQGIFWAYTVLMALLISPMIGFALQINAGMDIVRAFLITSIMFAGLSIYGYTTKKDLSGMGKFLMMAAIGLFAMMIMNIFIGSSGFGNLISIAVILVFAGLTAYETQQIKESYFQVGGGDDATRMAIFGAYLLYGSFMIMFIHILNLFLAMRGSE